MCVAGAIAGASLAGGLITSSASKSAANTEANAANNATAAQTSLAQQQLALQQSNNAPYRQAGTEALGQIMQVLGLPGGATLENTTSTQAQQTQANFDANAYLKQYPDVAKAAASPTDNPKGLSPQAFAWQHYEQFGQSEGRTFTGNANYQAQTGASAGASVGGAQNSANARGVALGAGGGPETGVNGSLGNAPGAATTSATGTAPGGFNPANIPGYTYGLNQADQTIENSALAKGTGLSGNTLQALQSAGQSYAGTAYQNYLSSLEGIASQGQASANNQAQEGTNTLSNLSSQVGSNITGAGNAIAAGTVGASNSLTGSINNGLNTYVQQQTLSNLFGNTGNSGGGISPQQTNPWLYQ